MRWHRFFTYLLFVIGVYPPLVAQNEDSVRYAVQNLNINSKRSDFSPFLFNHKLYFSSGRENDIGVKYYSIENKQELIDVFCAEKTDSVNFKKGKPLTEINTPLNDGPICISKDGEQLFITRNDKKRSKGKNKKPLSIFISHKAGNGWSEPKILPFCTGEFSYCHPALMSNGTLIFSSNVTGGYGGMDLYYSKFENGTWTIPRNYGPNINGKENEVFPFISANNMLYFSSNKKNGFGGLDIYSFNLKTPTRSQIQILESPVNSSFDDFGIWVDSTERVGYFSSNRDTANGDNIFYFKNKYPDFKNCTQQKRRTYCFTFFEEATQMNSDTLGMIYEWDFGDGFRKRGLEVKHCFKTVGNYSVQLNIIEKASGNLFYNELSYDFEVEEPKQFYIDCPDTIARSKAFTINTQNIFIPKHTIKDYFWFFGDGKFVVGTLAKHKYKTDGEYIIKLGVIAKNDSTGELEKFCTYKTVLVKDSVWIAHHKPGLTRVKFNSNISKQTAKTDSVNYRVHLGTSKNDIPVNAEIFNDLHNVKKYKEKDGFAYTSGYAKKVSDAIPEYKKAKEKGFKNAAVVSFNGDSVVANQQKAMQGTILDENTISIDFSAFAGLRKKNIFFDLNSAEINKTAYKYLDSLAGALRRNGKLELIILAASDKATEDNTKVLAKKRGAAVLQFFTSRGVKASRLDINTLGKNMPIEYEAGKNVVISNRRVQILLVKNAK
ncbi:MAG TPA: PKD domain-containing protein [Bacteroidia bacterium]|nr:PKD domain-containing protein [Bacteroidia bacterium]